MSVVQFPDGGAYPSAPLSANDERALALIARALAAHRALCSAYGALCDDRDPEDCPLAVQKEIARLHEAKNKPLADLAELVERDKLLADFLEADILGSVVSRSRRNCA